VPKAKPFPDSPDSADSEEEEKTTIESQWEEEASTTVEQGDVAEKIRSLGAEPRRGGTSETSTGAGALDEPTVDDQHAQQSAITPVRDVARLQISQGNDAGQELEIRPGKTYTIGRAIDNDFVLTDIAVSRKHFDLRFEDGAWVIVDRGSGNGTVVNGNLEDNPFMLANGDVIEIGNTVFRFDQPNAASRVDPQRTMDLEGEEEELSTVAGKPMRDVDVEPVRPTTLRPQRPKTLPPPMPLRAGAATQPPPLGFPPLGPSSMPQPSSTLPMAQMANRPPIGGPLPSLPGVSNPGAPTMLGDSLGMPMQNQLPTTLPGQGATPRAMYPYPQATEIPPHSVHAQMMLIQTQNRRGDHSTAHVPPAPYDAMPSMQRYAQPQLSKKSKLVLAGIGIAVVAGVLTVAIVKSSHTPAKPVAADTTKADGNADAKIAAKTAVDPAKTETPKAVTATPIAPAPTTTKVAAPPPSPTTVTPKSPAPTITTPTKTAAPQTATTAKTEPTKIEPTRIEPTKTPTPPPTVAKTEPPKTPTPPPTVAKTETPKPKTETKTEKTTRRSERSPERDRKAEARRVTEPAPSTTETPAPKRAGGSPDAALAEAERLYRQRKFSDAASYLQGQAKKFDEDVASDLRKTAGYYTRLAAAMSKATAPAQRASVAYEALVSAQTYDRSLGNAYDGEIQTKLAQVAPKAALSYVANKNYLAARNAMIFSKQFPGAAETVSLVKQKLETAASELYAEATAEMSSNPQGAKDKLKQILQITDPGSSWHKKAAQKLSGG
jgi:hypothetical protein